MEDKEFLKDIYYSVRELGELFMFDIATMPQQCKDEVIRIAREELEKLYQKLLKEYKRDSYIS